MLCMTRIRYGSIRKSDKPSIAYSGYDEWAAEGRLGGYYCRRDGREMTLEEERWIRINLRTSALQINRIINFLAFWPAVAIFATPILGGVVKGWNILFAALPAVLYYAFVRWYFRLPKNSD